MQREAVWPRPIHVVGIPGEPFVDRGLIDLIVAGGGCGTLSATPGSGNRPAQDALPA
jgi:hypothetical protein